MRGPFPHAVLCAAAGWDEDGKEKRMPAGPARTHEHTPDRSIDEDDGDMMVVGGVIINNEKVGEREREYEDR